ncbi:MAG: class II glutamine amidotransferase, partial [Rhodoferax sp.]|nr:class II glutamine amidotransferase [Rhodoferax sp.]
MTGLCRLEYRGYDSAGIAVDSCRSSASLSPAGAKVGTQIIKEKGKVKALEKRIYEQNASGLDEVYATHVGIAHTRWATHGEPSPVNSHPQRSDEGNEFVVVHNGIITNYKALKTALQGHGYKFESETDTEVIAKLVKYVYDTQPTDRKMTFMEIVEAACQQLEGAYACLFKSVHFPSEAVATRRGSPLIIGVRSKQHIHADENVQVIFNNEKTHYDYSATPSSRRRGGGFRPDGKALGKTGSQTRLLSAEGKDCAVVEYFMASDASAIIEHTNRVIYLEDEDVAAVTSKGELFIHQASKDEKLPATRAIRTLEMEMQQIMKGEFPCFMMKEIFEQTESVCNTMRGRVNFDSSEVMLGGLKSEVKFMLRARRLVFIACGTSYHSALAARALMEEMTQVPV